MKLRDFPGKLLADEKYLQLRAFAKIIFNAFGCNYKCLQFPGIDPRFTNVSPG